MALDHALRDLADESGTAVLRLYQWAHDTISFGTNESATRHWDRAAIEADGVPVVRRPSGGRAVWHDRSDLTYAWTGPLQAFGGQLGAYRALHELLSVALHHGGVPAALAPAPLRLPGLRRGACFDVAIGGEVIIGETKVIGSAQVVTQRSLLQHGAIARINHGERMSRYRVDGDRVRTSLAGEAPILPDARRLASDICAEFVALGGHLIEPELTTRANAASVKHVTRYHDPLWTWRR